MIGIDEVRAYEPVNEEEAADKKLMLTTYEMYGDRLWEREPIAHFTSSCLILNKEHTKVLLEYHRIYDTYAWCGGHNDGDKDFLHVALKEAKEETGLECTPIHPYPVTLNGLYVKGHVKHGIYLSGHLHFDLAYLLEADEKQTLKIKEDEVSDLKWFDLEEFKNMHLDIQNVYMKMIARL